jgi:hypothetical protein
MKMDMISLFPFQENMKFTGLLETVYRSMHTLTPHLLRIRVLCCVGFFFSLDLGLFIPGLSLNQGYSAYPVIFFWALVSFGLSQTQDKT